MNSSLKKLGRTTRLGIGILVGVLSTTPLFASTQLRSGPTQVSMLELFTSEGCNSCPPADHWVSELTDRPGLWVDYIPLAFHVDYWNDLGWKDRFAQPGFGARQVRYQDEGGVVAVYTPGVVLNGSEWRQWRFVPAPSKTGSSTGVLTADIDAGVTEIQFVPAEHIRDGLSASVAILGFGLESKIRAGENRGRILTHDFVVLGLDEVAMKKKERGFTASIDIPAPSVAAERYAVVVWVSSGNELTPLQAAGGWYKRQ